MWIENMLDTHYAIRAKTIDKITNSVYRIAYGKHEYALKQSSLNHDSLPIWHQVFKQADEHNLRFIQPVYLTKNGQLTTTYDDHVYYLSPWLNSTEELEFKQMYQYLGQLHNRTKLTRTVRVNTFADQFVQYKENCLKGKEAYMLYIENFEKQRYMSPFELQVCTHFHVVESCFNRIGNLTDHIINHQGDTIQWSQSLCHGNLTFSHMLSANGCTIINWERATYDNGTRDLIHLFQSEIIFYDSPTKDLLTNFSAYLEENQLTKEEICVLIIYLLNPLTYLQQIDKYTEDALHQPMIDRVQNQERLYRQLQFALEMYERFESDLS